MSQLTSTHIGNRLFGWHHPHIGGWNVYQRHHWANLRPVRNNQSVDNGTLSNDYVRWQLLHGRQIFDFVPGIVA